ncbi:MAG: TetR/AcrR family transcriptional regulator [Vicinamibacterales bacterium]
MPAPATRPGRESKEAVVAAFRRRALLAAASRVFGRKGFEPATMDEIATEAGVAKGTIYLYYPSKRAIYEATFASSLAEITAVTDAGVHAAPTPRAAIAAFVEARVRYFQEHPDAFRLYVTEVSRLVADRGPRRGACRMALDGHTRSLEAVFAAAVGRGEMRGVDPAAAAHAVFDITRGLVARRLLTCAESDAARDVAFLVELIWTGLAPGPHREGPTA